MSKASALARHVSVKNTPPTEKVLGKDQVKNSAGGYVFKVDDFSRLDRFLILGSEGGTYYVGEKKLTKDNAQCVLRCLKQDAKRTIDAIVSISDSGRAPKNTPAIFALALSASLGDEAARKLAYQAMPSVLRIPTHLFQFIAVCKELRGWGSSFKKAVSSWYGSKNIGELAYHLVKYQSRDGWSNRDVMRLAHPKTEDPARDAVYRWAVTGKTGLGDRVVSRKASGKPDWVSHYPAVVDLPRIIEAFEEAKTAGESTIVRLIREDRLPRECVPTHYLNSVPVWEALLESMPLTAMIRNLGKMTSIGLIKMLSEAEKLVTGKLGDIEYLKKSRVHPISILMALKQYSKGHGDKGSLSWNPSAKVVDALDAAFYLAFGNVEPANKKTLIGVDISGSMDSPIAGTGLTCREAAGAIAMVASRTEPECAAIGFATTIKHLDLGKYRRLENACAYMRSLPMGGTDCSLPVKFAMHERLAVDTFVTLTDNETWASGDPYPGGYTGSSRWISGNPSGHCFQWLKKYRDQTGIAARNIVAAFTATDFTIADPSDPLSLDVVGLDAALPQLITDFSAGRV